jgi:hypothetical protein
MHVAQKCAAFLAVRHADLKRVEATRFKDTGDPVGRSLDGLVEGPPAATTHQRPAETGSGK